MKTIISILILTYLFYYLPAQDAHIKSGINQVDALEFNEFIRKNTGILLDVRTEGEYRAEHITNSGQLNYYAFDFKKKLLLLPKDKPIYLYCNTGYRYEKAAEYLVKNGYTNVYNLEHGIMEWNLKELPVVEGDKSLLDKENMTEPDEFNKIISTDSLVFVDFYAPWCALCRKMMPMIDSLKTEYHGKIKIVKINVDISKKLIKELGLLSVPYFTIYKNNGRLYEHFGLITRDTLIKELNKYVASGYSDPVKINENKGDKIKHDKNKDSDDEMNTLTYENYKEPLKVGEIAPEFVSFDHKGNKISLSGLLKTGPVVLIFYRGQWCPVCNKHLSDLQAGLEKVKEKGAQIIAVTPEKPEYINQTISKTHISFPVLYDKDYIIMKSYKLDFVPKKETTAKYNLFLNADLKNAHSDDSQTLPVPATYIIGTDGIIKYVHFNPDYKDRASIQDILNNL